MKTIYKVRILSVVFLCPLFAGCVDDLELLSGSVVEGEPASVTVKWSVPGMTTATRALTDEQERTVNNLTVMVYNANTGKREYYDEQVVSPATTDTEHTTHSLNITGITSGKKYIVAVANAKDNYGISKGTDLYGTDTEDNGTSTTANTTELSTLLNAADTWQKFLDIAEYQNPVNVERTNANLVMSGCYYENQTSDPADWVEQNFTPVSIQAGHNNLPGAIHLRRAVAHVKFNIRAWDESTDGENTVQAENASSDNDTIITNLSVEVLSWQLFNSPSLTYLYEQERDSVINSATWKVRNAVDDAGFGASYGKLYGNSMDASQVPSGNLSDITGNEWKDAKGKQYTGYYFDFYQLGNKHTGILTGRAAYNDREKQCKNGGQNTGVWSALCSSEADSVNNYASYVRLHAKVEYDYQVGSSTTTTTTTTTSSIHRTGNVYYTIHLGAVNGHDNDLDSLNDFNCRRNTRYTYNVTVKSLSNIVVEACDHEEPQSAAEGTVIDVTDRYIELDAHYGVANIQLSNADRSSLIFSLQVPYNGTTYRYTSPQGNPHNDNGDSNTGGAGPALGDLKNHEFYRWLRFMPTTNWYTIAKYKPGKSNDGQSFANGDYSIPLDSLWDVKSHPHTEGEDTDSETESLNSETELWYTVFIDEYTYHADATGQMHNTSYSSPEAANAKGDETSNRWWEYVNQDNRICWLLVNSGATSDDRQSVYGRSKYAFSQMAIETFYSTDAANHAETAFGIEAENESFGIVLSVIKSAGENFSADDYSNTNGRWNSWLATGKGGTEVGGTDPWNKGNWYEEGGTYTITYSDGEYSISEKTQNRTGGLVATAFLVTPAISNWQGYSALSKLHHIPHYAYEHSYNASDYDLDVNSGGGNNNLYGTDALTACMNRNRDENGDGVIDASELRWFLPSQRKYTQLILGREALKHPGIDYYSVDDLSLYYGVGNDQNLRYHFITSEMSSDSKYIGVWLEEGGSTGTVAGEQIRCMRNLGWDMSTVDKDKDVENPYTHNKEQRTIIPIHYDSRCMRYDYATGAIEVHTIADKSRNELYYKGFVYSDSDQYIDFNGKVYPAVKIAKANTTKTNNGTYLTKQYLEKNNPCDTLNKQSTDGATNWRLPNFKEIKIMYEEDVLNFNDDKVNNPINYLSCTTEYFGNRSYDTNNDNNGHVKDISDGSDSSYVAPSGDLGVRRFLGATVEGTGAINDGWGRNADPYNGSRIWIRCVRDLN